MSVRQAEGPIFSGVLPDSRTPRQRAEDELAEARVALAQAEADLGSPPAELPAGPVREIDDLVAWGSAAILDDNALPLSGMVELRVRVPGALGSVLTSMLRGRDGPGVARRLAAGLWRVAHDELKIDPLDLRPAVAAQAVRRHEVASAAYGERVTRLEAARRRAELAEAELRALAESEREQAARQRAAEEARAAVEAARVAERRVRDERLRQLAAAVVAPSGVAPTQASGATGTATTTGAARRRR